MSVDQEAPNARKIRARYAAIGISMALLWVGQGGAPAWEHALRTVVMLMIVPPLLLWAERRFTPKIYESERPGCAVAQLVTARLLVVTGAFAVANGLSSLLDPRASYSLLIPAVLLLTVPWQIRHALRTRTSGVHPSTQPMFSAPRLIAAKLSLVAAALLAQLLLGSYLPYADLFVALGIAGAVVVLGPRFHSRLQVPQPNGKQEPAEVAA